MITRCFVSILFSDKLKEIDVFLNDILDLQDVHFKFIDARQRGKSEREKSIVELQADYNSLFEGHLRPEGKRESRILKIVLLFAALLEKNQFDLARQTAALFPNYPVAAGYSLNRKIFLRRADLHRKVANRLHNTAFAHDPNRLRKLEHWQDLHKTDRDQKEDDEKEDKRAG